MYATSSVGAILPTRRDVLATTGAAIAAGVLPGGIAMATGGNALRPFRVNVSQDAIDNLRRRLAATTWPDQETVDDRSQGVQLRELQLIVDYWGTDYDWRKVEARLNALPSS